MGGIGVIDSSAGCFYCVDNRGKQPVQHLTDLKDAILNKYESS
ncbi:hypothetical protein NEIMUCOT_04134 [Neisseria mucosa ATCC 25996]|uniref:Uncharacterized protein n=1 Tax=Neisseria mucosa (strain ATCC 25996 / DSM 4631 / NCTC 10774 / M26) TaxID=546266 RepID=D2ZU46_NEIM2|nr:hypothetical protein NEIMUCOT_04134 [Neisseria mucosa ATCC 25996]